jgi:hypothetical protein
LNGGEPIDCPHLPQKLPLVLRLCLLPFCEHRNACGESWGDVRGQLRRTLDDERRFFARSRRMTAHGEANRTSLTRFHRPTSILFGTSLYSDPIDDPDLPKRRVLRKVLVPSEWVRRMFSEVWGDLVTVWKGGTDTDAWVPGASVGKDVDVLIYDKIFWRREHYVRVLLEPLKAELRRRSLRVEMLRYGSYRGDQLFAMAEQV